MRIATFVLLLATAVQAQENRGAIQGRITDPSGAVVAGAQVNIRNIETGVVLNAVSNQDGNYQVPFLLPGNYSVAAEHAGFKKASRGEVRVATSAQVAVNFQLELGAATDTVTVDAKAPMLETSEPDLGLVINNQYVANVAISIYRNAINFARVAPGVTGAPAGT